MKYEQEASHPNGIIDRTRRMLCKLQCLVLGRSVFMQAVARSGYSAPQLEHVGGGSWKATML